MNPKFDSEMSLIEFYTDKSILLTGATGFLGMFNKLTIPAIR